MFQEQTNFLISLVSKHGSPEYIKILWWHQYILISNYLYFLIMETCLYLTGFYLCMYLFNYCLFNLLGTKQFSYWAHKCKLQRLFKEMIMISSELYKFKNSSRMKTKVAWIYIKLNFLSVQYWWNWKQSKHILELFCENCSPRKWNKYGQRYCVTGIDYTFTNKDLIYKVIDPMKECQKFNFRSSQAWKIYFHIEIA